MSVLLDTGRSERAGGGNSGVPIGRLRSAYDGFPPAKRAMKGGEVIRISRAEPHIRGHELPPEIVTFDGLALPYGELWL